MSYEKRGDREFYYSYGGDNVLSKIRYKDSTRDETYYVLMRMNGDVSYLTNEAGEIVAKYSYDAWGNTIRVEDGNGNVITDAEHIGNRNLIRYRGYYYDAETGFYYVSSRYYAPEIGRFISADGEIAGVGGDIRGYNMYSYCFNNPVNMSDPTGDWPKWVETAAKVVSVAVAVTAVVVMATTVAGVVAGTIATAAAGKAVLGATVLLGAALSGISGGVANERKGNSYANGYAGGFVGGGVQAYMSKNKGGTIYGGGIGVTIGTAVTDVLNNVDPDSANSSASQIAKNAATSGLKALATSSLTSLVGSGVGGVNYKTGVIEGAVLDGCGGLMPSLTLGFGEGIKAFFGWADDAVIYLWE